MSMDREHDHHTRANRVRANRGKILLHICCGPCAEWPLEALRAENFEVDAYFFNPNIHPLGEWEKRLSHAKKMADLHQLTLWVDEAYAEEAWRLLPFAEKSEYCHYCYRLRLRAAASFAASHGYDYLTSALLVSPYQDFALISRLGREICAEEGIKFVSRPFYEQYRKGQDMAVEDGLYRQKYCGCIFSLGETNPKYRKKVMEEYGLRAEDLPERRP